MDQEIEYAQMLEIPVSTVNVVKKKHRNFIPKQADLKEKLIQRINDLQGEDEKENKTETYNLDPVPVPEKPKKDRSALWLSVEFGAICALCGVIFLTNVFMPNSGINTFFRSFTEPVPTAKVKEYSDYTLTPMTSNDVELSVSPAGVISFTNKGCVYPMANGTVTATSADADGKFTVTISHTDNFYEDIAGLTSVYYAVGDKVYSNVPVGYSSGENEIRAGLYVDGTIISSYTLENGVPVWTQQSEE